MALKLLTFRNSTKIIAFKKNPNLQTVTMLCICSKNQNATKKWMTTGFLMAFCVTCKIETETVPVLVWVQSQELQHWAGGTLNTIKLIGMNYRFAKICIKAQEQKWLRNWTICQKKNRSFLFLCLCANFCEPGVHSY